MALLVPVPVAARLAAFAHSGGRLAAALPAPSAPGLYVLNTAGGVTSVPEDPSAQAAWSPTSRRLAVWGDQLQIVDSDTGVSQTVDTPANTAVSLVEWSPDGASLAYAQSSVGRPPAANEARLFILQVAGKSSRPVYSKDVSFIDWTPDGRGITVETLDFPQSGEAGATLLTLDPAIGAVLQILGSGAALQCVFQPLWSPDG